MKLFSSKYISPVTEFCAVAGLLLRVALEIWGIDDKGLYMTWHPLYIGLFALSALLVLWLLLSCRKLSGQPVFSSSRITFAGAIVAATGILVTDVFELIENLNTAFTFQSTATLVTLIASALCFVLGILASVALIFGGVLQRKGKRVHFLFYAVLTVYFLIHPLTQYRMWSSDPQLINYCFQLLASVCLLLTSYHRTALAAGKQGAKRYVFFSRLAIFFCSVSVVGEHLFYLAMLLWLLAAPCRLQMEEEI